MEDDPLDDVEDEPVLVDEAVLERLRLFRQRETKLALLPGVDVRAERARLTAVLDELVDRLLEGVVQHPSKRWVMSVFQRALEQVETEDTEGRDHFGMELETVMDILGIESSDGLLRFYLGGF